MQGQSQWGWTGAGGGCHGPCLSPDAFGEEEWLKQHHQLLSFSQGAGSPGSSLAVPLGWLERFPAVLDAWLGILTCPLLDRAAANSHLSVPGTGAFSLLLP